MLEEIETVDDEETHLEKHPPEDEDATEMFPEGHEDDVLPVEHEDHLTEEEAEQLYDQFQMEDEYDMSA